MLPDPGSAAPPSSRRRVALLVAILCVAAGAIYLLSRREALASVCLSPGWLAPLALAELVLLGLRGALLRRLCRALDVRLSWREAVGLQAGSVLANYVLPGLGGTSLRAAYLRGRHELPLAAFGSLLAATYVLQYLAIGVAGLAASLLSPNLPTAVGWTMAAALVVLAAVVAFASLPKRQPTAATAGGPAGFFVSAFAGWRRLREGGLATPLLVAAAQLVGTALALVCAFGALGRPLAAGEGLFVAALSDGSILLNLTPSGLGVVESAVGLAAGLLGIGAPLGVGAAALRRAVNVLVAATAAGLTVGLREHLP